MWPLDLHLWEVFLWQRFLLMLFHQQVKRIIRFNRTIGVLEGLKVCGIFVAFQAQYLQYLAFLGLFLHQILSEH